MDGRILTLVIVLLTTISFLAGVYIGHDNYKQDGNKMIITEEYIGSTMNIQKEIYYNNVKFIQNGTELYYQLVDDNYTTDCVLIQFRDCVFTGNDSMYMYYGTSENITDMDWWVGSYSTRQKIEWFENVTSVDDIIDDFTNSNVKTWTTVGGRIDGS